MYLIQLLLPTRRAAFGALLAALLWLTAPPARAQHENDIWYFGNRAGLSFATGAPTPLSNGALSSGEGCATVADAQGNLLLYTNGINVWNRQHQLLRNGTNIGGYNGPGEWPVNSATQGTLVVPRPGNPAQFYIFTVDAAEHGFADGLQYALVDVNAQGGQGEVLNQRNRLAAPVTEKLTAVRHINGQDTWVLVHGWQTNQFMAFLVTAAGVTASPVLSSIGSVHQGGFNSPRNDYNGLGYMRFSPDGRRLGVARYTSGVELFDFDRLTGQVSNPRQLSAMPAYGLEFSPSGNFLYFTDLNTVFQLDLSTGIQVAVSPTLRDAKGALLRGPDNRIYVARGNEFYLGVLNFPDLGGAQSGFQTQGVALGSASSYLGLPNQVTVPQATAPGPALGFTYQGGCPGQSVDFAAVLAPLTPGVTYSWDFGDPASGAANTATGANPTHVFSALGTFRVTLRASLPGGTALVAASSVPVAVGVRAELGPPVQVMCPGQGLVLSAGLMPPQTQYLWSNGATTPTTFISTPGLYWLQVATPQGCTSRDSVRLVALDNSRLTLGPDTSTCFAAPLRLAVQPAQPNLRYRWSDGSTGPTALATQAGTYWVDVTVPNSNCTRRLTRVIGLAESCQGGLPNIITPNGDGRNDFFVLQGLNAADWDVTIYNRWGKQVYQAEGYQNNWDAAGQPAGVYYYQLRYRAGNRSYRGWVEVVR